MVMVPQQVLQRRLTFEDYQQLPDDQDYEIVNGVLYIAPRPRPGHQIAAAHLAYQLTEYLRDNDLGTVIPDVDLVICEQDTYVSPDLMVFLRDRFAALDLDDWIRIVPDLVVEVLSPSTEDYDRTTKRRTYAELGVPHYWMADPRGQALIECVLEPQGQYRERIVSAPEMFRPALFPNLEIDLARIFG